MSDQPMYKCLCKGTRKESAGPRTSINWVTAKRVFFRVFDDRIECGKWRIAYADVQKATLYRFKHMFMRASVIHLETADGHYQFGFNPWASPADHMNLTFQEEDVKLEMSISSVLYRLVIFTLLAVWVWWEFLR